MRGYYPTGSWRRLGGAGGSQQSDIRRDFFEFEREQAEPEQAMFSTPNMPPSEAEAPS